VNTLGRTSWQVMVPFLYGILALMLPVTMNLNPSETMPESRCRRLQSLLLAVSLNSSAV